MAHYRSVAACDRDAVRLVARSHSTGALRASVDGEREEIRAAVVAGRVEVVSAPRDLVEIDLGEQQPLLVV